MQREIGPILSDLHLLTVLEKTKSFTEAARLLGVSKASVSARIKELERSTAVPLVRRTTRSVVLTDAGLGLVRDIETSFARIAESVDKVKNLAGAPRGLLRVTAPVALGRQVIAPALASFLIRYPEVRLDLDLSDRVLNLAQDGFDLAIRHTDSPPDTYVAWPLSDSRSLLLASRSYLRRRGIPKDPAALAEHDCLMYLRDLEQTWSFEKTLGRKRKERIRVPVSGPLRANNSEVLREAVVGGLGIALLPDFTAKVAIESGQLDQVLADWRPVGFFGQQIFAIRPWAAHVPKAVRCLVDHLRRSLASS